MEAYKPMNSLASFEMAKVIIEDGYKKGKLSREQAHKILSDARRNYSNQSYNREIEKINRQNKYES